MNVNWTDAHVATLSTLWREGIDCTKIALALGEGFTKNSVIGKARRIELPPHPAPNARPSRPRRTVGKDRVTKRPHKVWDKPVVVMPIRERPSRVLAPPSLGLALMQLSDMQCHWIAGNDRLYCGHPTSVKCWPRPYCEAHGAARLRDMEKYPIRARAA